MSLCANRLMQERKQWRKDHPFGFWAKPRRTPEGELDLMVWEAGIPGKAGTIWEGGVYPVTLYIPKEYPTKPPKCQLPKGFYHPNIYPSGTVCLSILNEGEDWRPALSLKEILLGIQELLHTPNVLSPAQSDAYRHFKTERETYLQRVRKEVEKYKPENN